MRSLKICKHQCSNLKNINQNLIKFYYEIYECFLNFIITRIIKSPIYYFKTIIFWKKMLKLNLRNVTRIKYFKNEIIII